ncbi:prephenate dehydrogenase [Bordetella trematum]|uniref:prephenate dehydrogenase n=1 Tax=Bordetella trematum TaxID=123899 RepID=UPI000D86CEC4|nr:prephenate dehydrogenase/arogenate dehydrogenase family protein [Bordetella trematum]SPU54000.1 prephenate dehydrogenase [Bordetella trematum]VDH06500.1 Arogenate dehydrogenase [Bordetella trematum]
MSPVQPTGQPAAQVLVPVLAVVGVGLIGGSFAAALRRAGQAGRVLGVGRNPASLADAQAMGLIDEIVTPQEAAARADLIMLATPVGSLGPMLASMRDHLQAHTILTDAGSTKAEVVAAASQALGDRLAAFVPGHPIAGAERTGPQAADATLYAGRTVILTPLAQNPPQAVQAVRAAWQACGAEVLDMEAAEHDRVLASISHVPHFLSAAYMAQVAEAADAPLRLALAGSGFRDFTRIAAGSPEMWRDIFLSNRAAMQTELSALRAVLDRCEAALAAEDGEALQQWLQRAALARRGWRKEAS